MEVIVVDFKGTREEAIEVKSKIVKSIQDTGEALISVKNNKPMDLGAFMQLIEEELFEVGIEQDIQATSDGGNIILSLVK